MCTDNLSYYLTCIDIMAIRFLDLNFYELVNNLKKHKIRFISDRLYLFKGSCKDHCIWNLTFPNNAMIPRKKRDLVMANKKCFCQFKVNILELKDWVCWDCILHIVTILRFMRRMKEEYKWRLLHSPKGCWHSKVRSHPFLFKWSNLPTPMVFWITKVNAQASTKICEYIL